MVPELTRSRGRGIIIVSSAAAAGGTATRAGGTAARAVDLHGGVPFLHVARTCGLST